MRFVFSMCVMGLLAMPAWAQPGQIYSLKEVAERRSPIVTRAKITRQVRSSQNMPHTIDGFQVTRTASGLGNISAMALADDGTIFTADQTKGRITRLSDRGQDGQVDTTRTIASGLNAPSGLVVFGDWIYIADSTAIWRMSPAGGVTELFVSLQNTGAIATPRPLLANTIDNQLMLGLSFPDQSSKIVAINLDTKRADLMTSGHGQITALAGRPKGPFWAGVSGRLVPIIKGQPLNADMGQNLEPGVDIGGLILPGQFDSPEGWPDTASSDIIASQGEADKMSTRSSGGFNVISVPTEFGQPASEMRVLVDGFLTRTRRSAWGQPGAMVMDNRGLFIADRWSGTVWRLSKTKAKPTVIIEPEPDPVKPLVANVETQEAESVMTGSSIGSGSQINTASKIQVGSPMVKEYEAKEAERKAAEKAKKDKKKKPKTLDKSAVNHSLD